MNLRLFQSRPFVMGCIVAFIYGTALFGSTYLLPLFIQPGLGLSAPQVGTLMLPAGLLLALVLPLGGRLTDSQPIHWLVVLGMGLNLPALNMGILRPLARPLISQGASTLSFIRMLGGVIGVGLCGIVLEWRLTVHAVHTALPAARLQVFHNTIWQLTMLCLLAICAAWQLRSAPVSVQPSDH